MDVIGHDDESIQFHGRAEEGDSVPFLLDDLSQPGVGKERVSPVGADGYEVGAGVGVVIGGYADGTAVEIALTTAHGL